MLIILGVVASQRAYHLGLFAWYLLLERLLDIALLVINPVLSELTHIEKCV
jgi:hypothetical protein